jgi:hypothetical protein
LVLELCQSVLWSSMAQPGWLGMLLYGIPIFFQGGYVSKHSHFGNLYMFPCFYGIYSLELACEIGLKICEI